MEWGKGDRGELALGRVARILDRFSLHLPEDSSFVQAAPDPVYRRHYFQRLGRHLYERTVGTMGRLLVGRPTLVTEREWDVLIILDACRYDTFCAVYGQQVPYIMSPGSATFGWVEANFVRNPERHSMKDAILVTANPAASVEYFDLNGWAFPFAECRSVWKDGWDFELDTVRPSVMVKACCEALLEGPSKAIFHFLQPHAPFIAEPGIRIVDRTRQVHRFHVQPDVSVWGMIERGIVSIEEARNAYEANLRLVMDWALRLASVVAGRVAISSDHGNLFGEYGMFGHPQRVHLPEVLKVPWLELDGGGGDPSTLLQEIEAHEQG